MRPKIQRFFMLFLAVLLCLSGCGKKEEALTDPEDMVSSGPGYPDVAAGQSYFYYKNCYGELYAISAGNQKKTALGAGKLLGADEQYAYIWQESKLRVMDGAKQAAEFDCLLVPSYWSTKNGCAYFSVENEDASCSLLILRLSSLMMEQHQVGVQIMSAAVEENQFYYVRFNAENKQILCRYDLESAEEQLLSELGFSSRFPRVIYVSQRLYYATDTKFCCYHLAGETEEILLQAEVTSVQYNGDLAYIQYNKDQEHYLWIYDTVKEKLISDEKSGLSIASNDFGLTFWEDGKYWFEKETEKVDFKDRPIRVVCGSPAGLIVGTWSREVLIAFKKSEGGYRVQLVEKPF